MSRAIVVREVGGPEVLKLEERELGSPGPAEIKLRHRAIGVNFADIYNRVGLYKTPVPFTPDPAEASTPA